jgi:hypothetical protein
MSTATPPNTGSSLAALQNACQRRSMAEIELEAASGETQPARIRLLACDEQRLFIDRPMQDGIPLEHTT